MTRVHSFGDIVRISDKVDGFAGAVAIVISAEDALGEIRVAGPVEPGALRQRWAIVIHGDHADPVGRAPLALKVPASCDGDHAAPECASTQCWRKEPQPRTFADLAVALEDLKADLAVHFNERRAEWRARLEGSRYREAEAFDPDLGQAIRGALAAWKP